MRIAYIALYQGPSIVKSRPTLRNKSMSRQIKIELVASALEENGHEVEILSSGEVVDQQFRFYRGCVEAEPFHQKIPIHYASALPVRWLNGTWSNQQMLRLFQARHRASPFDLVIIWNMKGPHVKCANWAIQECGLPVILGYEDDAFLNRSGEVMAGNLAKRRAAACRKMLKAVSGCMAVSPYLLSQAPDDIPKLLLRGAVGEDIIAAGKRSKSEKKNWIVFAGTHVPSNGVAELMEGWRAMNIPDWELHIAGHGAMTEELRTRARDMQRIKFHGLVSREALVELLSTAKICVNPHAVTQTPGNLFAFKIIEYLAAGASVVTTPMGQLENELEAGITYMPDNSPGTIASTLEGMINEHKYERTAMEAAQEMYGPAPIAKALNSLVVQVKAGQFRGKGRAPQIDGAQKIAKAERNA